MTIELVLSIINQSLILANTMALSMSPEQRQQLWERHNARMERWEAMLDKLQKG